MPSWRQIEAFRAVMLTGSMTSAADTLSVTQPAISRLIQELEITTGFPLFLRRKGGLTPSTQAVALFAEVQRSFVGRENIERAIGRIRNNQEGHLRVASMPALAASFLPLVIKDLLEEHERVSVSLQTHNSPTVVDLVRSRHYDLGFAMTPVDGAGVQIGPILRARCVCILPLGHRLCDRSAIDLGDLEGESFISLAKDTTTRLKIDAAFRAANVSRRLALETRASSTICSFVLLGLGVSIVDPFSAVDFASRGGIVRPLVQEIDFSFVRITAPSLEKSSLLADFLSLIDQHFRPHLSQ